MNSCKAPDPEPRAPRFSMPPLACDAHCHVFGPAARFPYAPGRAYTPPDAPKERLSAVHEIVGVQRAVIVQASCHGTDNRAMLDAIATSSGRYRGIAIVDGSFTEKDYAALHEGGVRGARFNFVKHLGGTPDMNVFNHVLQRIQPLGWHLVVHLDAADIVELSGLLRALSLPFVIDHMRTSLVMLGVWRVFQGFLTVTARPLACLHRDRLAGLHGGQIDRPAGFHGLVVPSGKPERDRVPPLIDVFIDVLNLFGDLWSGIERRKQDL